MADTDAPHHYKFNIQMNCGGCSGAINRVLKKTEGKPHQPRSVRIITSFHVTSLESYRTVLMHTPGIRSYTVSLEDQTADIYAEESLEYETVLEKIKKTGKQIKSGEKDGVAAEI